VRSALLAEQARLQGEAAALDADELALAAAQRVEGGIAGDTADVASDLVEAEVDEAVEQTVRQRLADIDAGLHRLQTDTYGRCEECGGPIDPARLRALPWARRCLSCQRRAERPIGERQGHA
jgi:RNA polymerase-binding transcription factor DksA